MDTRLQYDGNPTRNIYNVFILLFENEWLYIRLEGG